MLFSASPLLPFPLWPNSYFNRWSTTTEQDIQAKGSRSISTTDGTSLSLWISLYTPLLSTLSLTLSLSPSLLPLPPSCLLSLSPLLQLYIVVIVLYIKYLAAPERYNAKLDTIAYSSDMERLAAIALGFYNVLAFSIFASVILGGEERRGEEGRGEGKRRGERKGREEEV